MDLAIGTIVGSRYTVGELISGGICGKVFKGIDNNSLENVSTTLIIIIRLVTTVSFIFQVAIKVENGRGVWLANENRAYVRLNGVLGVPKVMWYGSEFGMNFLIMEFLGSNISQIRKSNDYRPFGSKTTLLFAMKLTELIQDIHSHNILHNDIHNGNVMMGLGTNSNVVYLVDFGFAKVVDIAISTCSTASQKKDLTDAAEIFRKLIQGGSSNVVIPHEFSKYIMYCNELQAHEKPDYEFLKNIFVEAFQSSGFTENMIFDL